MIIGIIFLILLAICVFAPNSSRKLTDYELYGTDDLEEYEKAMTKKKKNNE